MAEIRPEEITRNGSRQGWKQDPEAVKADILRVALAEFAENGLSGTRMDEISAKTKTSKRMIYYYFGNKEDLYRRVLEEAYREVRKGEEELKLDHMPPVEALRKLVAFTFDHHSRHPDFIRLVMIENIHHGSYLKQSDIIRDLNVTAINELQRLYSRGVEAGEFRKGISPLELHWQISALSFFNVSNRMTFSMIFGDQLFSKENQNSLRESVVELIVRNVKS
ncbi:TetR/AcrR family transcriptional regulator [Sneathiella limimaris]|uniref:TetR/AcrR family transcriptional regulator n=1 Tax=Sneathiella limimaris TaxID=1964213 RepID=UPI00146C649D|nr:TetR/AcrR family transcriptional regulator [Sneathiella limimaris]